MEQITEQLAEALALCVEEIAENLEFEGRLTSFVVALRKSRDVLKAYEATVAGTEPALDPANVVADMEGVTAVMDKVRAVYNRHTNSTSPGPIELPVGTEPALDPGTVAAKREGFTTAISEICDEHDRYMTVLPARAAAISAAVEKMSKGRMYPIVVPLPPGHHSVEFTYDRLVATLKLVCDLAKVTSVELPPDSEDYRVWMGTDEKIIVEGIAAEASPALLTHVIEHYPECTLRRMPRDQSQFIGTVAKFAQAGCDCPAVELSKAR